MIQFMQRQKKRSKLDMTPLIDVVFLLLVFFLLTLAIQGEGMDISLPEGQASEGKNQENLSVKIGKDGALKINDQLVPIELLKKTLENRLNERIDKSVIVEAHQTTRYELFTKVLDVSRMAGAEGFTIIK